MSLLAGIAPVVVQAAPVVHTVVVEKTSHLFQLAQIIEFLGTGVGLSVMHSVLERGKLSARNLSWVNVVLVPLYCGIMAVVELLLKGSLDISNWYVVFTQVLAGAVVWYGVLTAVNKASGDGSPVAATQPTASISDLPISTNP